MKKFLECEMHIHLYILYAYQKIERDLIIEMLH